MVGGNSPSHGGLDVFGIDGDDVVELSIGIGGEGLPALDRFIPIGFRWRVWAALEEVESGLVWVDVSAACPALDRHVADGHAFFH